jgi:hypothetical protein
MNDDVLLSTALDDFVRRHRDAPPPRFNGRLSRALDYAQAQLEAADDPEVVAVFRRLVADLERIALPKGDGR